MSFYNQSTIDNVTVPVLPTPTIGMIGLVEDKKYITPLSIESEGMKLFLLGEHSDDMGSSQFLIHRHGVENSPSPAFDLDREYTLQQSLMKLIRSGLIAAAHDVSDGGLFTALFEMSAPNGVGFEVEIATEKRMDGVLFGEAQSRVVVAIRPEQEQAFIEHCRNMNQPIQSLGVAKGNSCVINGSNFGTVQSLNELYHSAMPAMMAN